MKFIYFVFFLLRYKNCAINNDLNKFILEIAQPEDENVDLTCSVNIKSKVIIQWSINSIPLHHLPKNNRRFLLDNGRILRIYHLNYDIDSGLYQCNASNFFEHKINTVFLKVEAFAPQFKMPIYRKWKVIHYSTVLFNCDVKAAPLPIVSWIDANNSIIHPIPKKIEILPNNTLKIFNVNLADEGYYYCNVSNKYGINRAMNKLEVYSASNFVEIPQPSRLLVNAFSTIKLRCRANYDPRLKINYYWTHNKKLLNTTYFFNNGTSILLIKNLRGNFSGQIKCVFKTDVDTKSIGIELLVQDIPEKPILVKIDCAYNSKNQAMIVWRKSPDNSASITSFSVDVMTNFRPNYWKKEYEEHDVTRNLFKLILPLSPWVNYTFRIIAHNSFGPSPAAVSNSNICKTKPNVPFKNPDGVKLFGTEPGNLVILWNPLSKEDWNAPRLRYLIRYRLIENKNNFKQDLIFLNHSKHTSLTNTNTLYSFYKRNREWNKFFIEDPFLNKTIVRDLPIFSKYEVQIHAINLVGYCATLPQTYIGYSGEDIPKNSPQNLRISNFYNFSTVILEWDEVKKKSIQGYFRGYKIVYWLSSKPYYNNYLIVNNKTLKAEINFLNALTNYSAQAFVLNRQYTGPPSNLLQFTTPEGSPSNVHNMRVYAVGSTSVFVTWEQPLFPNGMIRGYYILFENSTNGYVEETYVFYRQLYYLHEFLEPDLPYKISVWAETKGGEGPKVVRLIRTWKSQKPDKPIFTVKSFTPNSVEIEWYPFDLTYLSSNMTRQRFCGTTFNVKYKKIGQEKWSFSESVTLPSTKIQIINLTNSIEYKFIGVAHDNGINNQLTESLPILFQIKKNNILSFIDIIKLQKHAWLFLTLSVLLIVFSIIIILFCKEQCLYNSLYEIRFSKIGVKRYKTMETKDSIKNAHFTTFLDNSSDEHKRFLSNFYKQLFVKNQHVTLTKKKKTYKTIYDKHKKIKDINLSSSKYLLPHCLSQSSQTKFSPILLKLKKKDYKKMLVLPIINENVGLKNEKKLVIESFN